MNKSEPSVRFLNCAALSILGVLLFPMASLQARAGVGQEMADLQKGAEQIASPIIQQQKAEQSVAAKRLSEVGDSSKGEIQQELDRALEELKRTRQADAERASAVAVRADAASKGAREELAKSESAVAAAEQEVDKLRKALDAARSTAGRADKSVAAAQQRVKDVESALAKAKAAVATAKNPAEAAKAKGLADKAASDLAAATDEVSSSQAAHAALLGNVKAAEKMLADAKARHQQSIASAKAGQAKLDEARRAAEAAAEAKNRANRMLGHVDSDARAIAEKRIEEQAREASRKAEADAKAAEKAAVDKLSAERQALVDKTAAEAKAAKEGVDKAAAELQASEIAAKNAARLAAERLDAEKASIGGAEEAEDQAQRARRNVKRLAEKKADAQKAAGEAKGDKAVLAAKAAAAAVDAELSAAQAEADKAVAKAKTASDQKDAAMKARLETERSRSDAEGDVAGKRGALAKAEDASELARRRNEDAKDKLADAARDAKSALADERRKAKQRAVAAEQAERDRQREAKRLQEVKLAAEQRDQELRKTEMAEQRARENARRRQAEEARAAAAKASAKAEQEIAVAKSEKAAADKAAADAQARFESDKALAGKTAESSKLAAAALAAAIAAEKTADQALQKAESEQAVAEQASKAASRTAADAAEAAADAKAAVAKSAAALESAKATALKNPKDKAAADAKAATISAAEKRLADAKAAEAAADAKWKASVESDKAQANAMSSKKAAVQEAEKALVSARASLDKAEGDAAAKASAYKKAQGALADSQDDSVEAKQSAASAASALDAAEGRLASASKTLAGTAAAAPVAGATQGSPSGATLGDVRLVSARHDDVDWFKTTEIEGGQTLFGLLDSHVRKGEPLADALLAVQNLAISNGYYLATFTVEDEKTIMIDKGRFGDVDVSFKDAKGEGTWYSKEQIKRKLEREGVAKGNVFDYNKLYSAFKELSAYPDLEVALRLIYDEKMAAGEQGEGNGAPADELRMLGVAMQVKEDVPVHGVVGVDNFGTSSYDNWIGRATLQWLNPTRVDDAITVNALGSLAEPGAMYGAAGSYYRPFILDERAKGPFSEGAFTLHGGYTEVDTEDVVPEIDVEGTGWFAGVQGSLRLLDNRMHRLDLSAGITYRSIENGLVVSDDRLDDQKVDVAPISLALLYTGKGLDSWNGRNYGTLEMVYNQSGFLGTSEGEEILLQRDNANEDFYLIGRAQVARVQMLSFGDLKGVSGSPMLFMKLDGQMAADPLIPAEQMGVGGHATVRGYEEREFLGDNAITGTLEFRTPIYLGILDRKPADAKGKPAGRYIAWDRTQLVFFFDFGWFQLEDALGKGEDDSKFLCSVGPGLRAAVGSNLQLRVDWGIPLNTTSESEGAGAVHVSLQGQF